MADKTMLLMLGYWFSICIAQLSILLLLKNVYKFAKNRMLVYCLSILTSIVLSFSVYYIENLPAVYLIAFICESLLLSFCFKMPLIQSYLCSSFYVFHMIAIKGIVIGTMSLTLKMNGFLVVSDRNLNSIAIMTTQVMMILLFLLYKHFLNAKKMRNFLLCISQVKIVLSCHLTILMFMIFNTFTFYYNLDLVWISVSQILTGLILGVVYSIILRYGINIADFLQYRLRSQHQLETIKTQMRQQNSIKRTEEILNRFKHDYREQMLSIEYFVENNKKEEALQEVHKNYIAQLNALPHSKKYSNNVIVNSLFVDRQEQCDELHINMDVRLLIPPYLCISEKDCHEIFRILSENAIEANEKIPEEMRYLKIQSTVEKQWLNVVIENAFNGSVILDNGRPSAKETKGDTGGMSLVYIEELLDSAGCILRYYIDSKNKTFKVVLLLRIDDEEVEIA